LVFGFWFVVYGWKYKGSLFSVFEL
jgi:hypothetical protein